MAGIKIPVEAQVNAGDLSQATEKFVQQFNRMGEAIAQANKAKFSPIDKATLDDMRKIEQQFESLRKISGAMNRRMKDTGQSGSGFFDVDWGRMYSDPNAKAREMRKAFEYVTGHAFQGTPPATAGTPARPSPANQNQPPPSPGASWGGAGRRIVSSGLHAAGPAGGAVDGALSTGMRGGVMAGLAGLVGGIVAIGVGKAISSVMGKVGDAQNELVQYDTLKRTLGDVNVGFEGLKESLRWSSAALDVTFAEGQRLGTEFAKIADISPEAHKSLAEEVAIGGGFGRSFGLDPGASSAFFAQMRLMRVTENETDSRRMSLMIGEAIAKSGSFAKADEILQSIGNFTAQQTRLGLVSANVGGYAAMLSGMVGSNIPGLDPAGSAALLSRVNAAITGGGAAGEAGQNFTYMALGRRLGLDPIQTRILQEQGAFGTGASTFGAGGLYSEFAQEFGLSTPGTAAGSQATNLQMLMERFRKTYADRPELMVDAMSNYFGINTSQAMALSLQKPEALGGIMERLGRSGTGLDLSRLSYTGISALGQIHTGSRSTLEAQASSLFARTGSDSLSPHEKERLTAALSGDDEQLRDVLTELTATREQERTEGSETRRTIAGIDRTLQEMAGRMVPLFNDMRAGILAMAGVDGKTGPMALRQRIAQAESDERVRSLHGRYSGLMEGPEADLQRAIDMGADVSEDALHRTYRDNPEVLERKLRDRQEALELRKRAQAEIDRISGEQSAAVAAERSRLSTEKSEIEKAYAATPATEFDAIFESLLHQESGGVHIDPKTGDLVTNADSGARGIAQIMPGTGKDPGFGVMPLRNDSEEEHRRFSRDYLRALMRHYKGDRRKALAAFNWGAGNVDKAVASHGEDWLSQAPKETQDYVPEVLSRAGDMYGTPIPGGVRAGDASAQAVDLNVNVTGVLNDTKGGSAGVIDSQTVKTRVGTPNPSGVYGRYGAQG